jgi:hypothetical protein
MRAIPREAEILFHNALMNSDELVIEDPDDFDFMVRLARSYARKIKCGVRTDRKNGTFAFREVRDYTKTGG